jgi:hypothetical protein
MPSSGMLRCVALVRTDVLEERIASIIKQNQTPCPLVRKRIALCSSGQESLAATWKKSSGSGLEN